MDVDLLRLSMWITRLIRFFLYEDLLWCSYCQRYPSSSHSGFDIMVNACIPLHTSDTRPVLGSAAPSRSPAQETPSVSEVPTDEFDPPVYYIHQWSKLPVEDEKLAPDLPWPGCDSYAPCSSYLLCSASSTILRCSSPPFPFLFSR